MTAADIAVDLTGLALIAGFAWYFCQPRTATNATVEGGRQVADTTVKGGYSPTLNRVEAGTPFRLRSHRQEQAQTALASPEQGGGKVAEAGRGVTADNRETRLPAVAAAR